MQKKNFLQKNYLDITVALLPLSFLIGNFAINANIFLFCLLVFLKFKLDIFKINFKNENHLILIVLFFFTVLFSTILNLPDLNVDIPEASNDNFLKSVLYLRYLVLLLTVKKALDEKLLNLRVFGIVCLAICTLISLDIFLQKFSGSNILGFETKFGIYNTSIFEDELIAGDYLSKFSIFGIIPIIFLSQKKIKKNYIIFTYLTLIIISILFAGNRMSFVLFLLLVLLIIILNKKLRLVITCSLLVSMLASASFIYSEKIQNFMDPNLNFMDPNLKDNNLYTHYMSFYYNAKNITKIVKKGISKEYPELKNESRNSYEELNKFWKKKKNTRHGLGTNYEIIHFGSGHAIIFITAIDVFKQKKIFGGGIKSFRINCIKRLHLPNRVCESHPHNYYMEILTDVGLVGAVIFLLLLTTLFIRFKNKIFVRSKNSDEINVLILIFLVSFLIQIFPLKSSGSFFSTSSASYIFFLLGFLTSNMLGRRR